MGRPAWPWATSVTQVYDGESSESTSQLRRGPGFKSRLIHKSADYLWWGGGVTARMADRPFT
jgi:hypothetical protein